MHRLVLTLPGTPLEKIYKISSCACEMWDTYKGIPPTGKRVTWAETWIYRIADGKLVELWSNEDDVGMLQQIGALPMPGQASQ